MWKLQKCIGVVAHNSIAEIHDRYIQIAFDVKVTQADETCLFADFESTNPKPFDLAKNYEKLTGRKVPV
jgi:hypothetical protein